MKVSPSSYAYFSGIFFVSFEENTTKNNELHSP